MSNHIDSKQYSIRFKQKFGKEPNHIGPYLGYKKRLEHVCSECKETFYRSPISIIKSGRIANGNDRCVKCCQILGKKEFIEKINKKYSGKIECLSYYKGKSLAKLKCNTCGNVWGVKQAKTLLQQNRVFGCKQCAIEFTVKTRKMYKQKKVVTSKGNISLEGFEDIAYRYVHNIKGVKHENIKASSSGLVPTIEYKYKNKKRKYYPDFLVNNDRIVEVKSLWTLGKDYEVNQKKAKACIKKGLKFNLLVVDKGRVFNIEEDWVNKPYDYVFRKVVSKKPNPIRILSLDPGVTNFAWSVLEIDDKDKIKVIATGMLEDTVTDLKSLFLSVQMEAFIEDVKYIIRHFKVTEIVYERFMTRGHKGTTIELISYMIGALVCSTNFRVPVRPIIAAQWKNEYNKINNIENLYKQIKGNKNLTIHQVDSILIGLYGYKLIKNSKENAFKSAQTILNRSKSCLKVKLTV